MNSAIASLEYSNADTGGLAGIKQWLAPGARLALVNRGDDDRAEVERYIQAKFSQSYGASLSYFLPQLITLRCGEHLSGASGVTLAKRHPALFLEQYLDAPVQDELERITGMAVSREGIAEVGNLVATTRGASRLVFVALASALHRAGLNWMVFTATAPLQASLRKLGFSILPIHAANPGRLPGAGSADWGSYYQYAPEVVAGRLDDAMQLITSHRLNNGLQHLFHEQIDGLAAALAVELR